MDYLFDGVKDFNAKDFLEHRELFRHLGRNQNPHTLFIGCSDSRLVPNMITKTLPGELFVVRNVANIVPPHRESNEFLATTAAVEYAVKVLNVENILVCGHSNCGGCNALYLPDEKLKNIPHTKKWLELAKPVKEKAEKELHDVHDDERREWITEQLNIIEQMNHLLTYPYILEHYRNGKIRILGWYYIIETGEIFNYSAEEKKFLKIE